MMRHITLTLTCLMVGSLFSQAQVLVRIKSDQSRLIEADQTDTLDLSEYFQLYSEPGPVAEFTLRMPIQTGVQLLQKDLTIAADPVWNPIPDYDPEGSTLEFMTYELAGGGTYAHVYDPVAKAANFVWQEYTVNFQLLADVAPVTVGNFISYVQEDAFDKTIIHRSDTDLGIVQMGSYTISDTDELTLTPVDGKGTIDFEETIPNGKGTLGMASVSAFRGGENEFFINLVDNSDTLQTAFTVFGEVINPDANMPVLEQLGDPYVYNLRDASVKLGSAFATTPLYTPFLLEPESWLSIQEIAIPEGNPDGVTYSFDFGDLDGEEGTSDEEAAFEASWDISINGNTLEISRNDTGIALLEVKGTFGDQESSFVIPLTGYNTDALNAFPSAAIETEGYLNSSWYGRLQAETYPEVMHENHGKQWIFYEIIGGTGFIEYYIFDEKMDSWIYTDASIHPYIYNYTTEKWLAYVRTTGGGDDNPRWFYDVAAETWYFEE